MFGKNNIFPIRRVVRSFPIVTSVLSDNCNDDDDDDVDDDDDDDDASRANSNSDFCHFPLICLR